MAAAQPDVSQLFAAVDTDRSGQIDHVELQRALSNGGWKPFSLRCVKLLIRIFDRDRSGTIDYGEFAQLWKYLGDWSRCFKGYDRDGSGKISFAEFQQALTAFGYRVRPETIGLIFGQYDADKSGELGFDEFVSALSELNILTSSFRVFDTTGTGTATFSYEQFLTVVFQTQVKA